MKAARHLRILTTITSPIRSSSSSSRRDRIRKRLDERILENASSSEQESVRRSFSALEEKLEKSVDYSSLSPTDRLVHERHKQAVKRFELMYDDPMTGLKVMTRWRHFIKIGWSNVRKHCSIFRFIHGQCCGNACRHCIYQHEKVPPERRAKRRFNSAFWENKD